MRTELVLALAGFFTGCSAVLGTKDIYLAEESAASATEGDAAAPDGTPGADGGPSADPDAPDRTCKADLQSDPKNCGRCGRDCLGAPCNVGLCAPVTLANGLANPANVTVAAGHLYVTTYGDGRVLEIPTAGGPARELAKEQRDAWGVLVDGPTLYWVDNDYVFEPPPGTYKGGLWKCTLPACAAPELVTPADKPNHVAILDGFLYVTEENKGDIVRVRPDGTQRTTIATATRPFGIVVDATHAYFTSSQPQLYRAPLAGGGPEAIGPQGTYRSGSIALDAERVYWASSDAEGKGRVLSTAKANLAAPRIEYGTGDTNKEPTGVAVDDQYVYWATHGSKTGQVASGDGQVFACPKKGCPAEGPIVLVKELARPYGIAVDETSVYVAEFTNISEATGSVRKVAKP